MSTVTMVLRIMPDDDTVSLEDIKDSIKETLSVNIQDSEREDVAFGLQALKILVQVEDDDKTEEIGETIEEGIDDVKSVEVESLSRE